MLLVLIILACLLFLVTVVAHENDNPVALVLGFFGVVLIALVIILS